MINNLVINKRTIIIWAPFTIGLILLLVTKIGLYQFSNQEIDIRSLLHREALLIIPGLLLSIVILISSIYWLIKKQWLLAVQTVISPFLFILCVVISQAIGGVFLYAT